MSAIAEIGKGETLPRGLFGKGFPLSWEPLLAQKTCFQPFRAELWKQWFAERIFPPFRPSLPLREGAKGVDFPENARIVGRNDSHRSAGRELQQGQLDGEPKAIRSSSSTINQFSLFLGKGVVTSNISIGKVRGNLCQGVALFRVEVRRDLVISRHGRYLPSLALFVS
jgi:hypothetical protein